MTTLQTLVDRACDDASAASSDLSNQTCTIRRTGHQRRHRESAQPGGGWPSISSQTVKTDLTQFKQNLKDTTGDASDPNATKQPDGAIIDPGYSIGDLTGSSSEAETPVAAPEESADTAPSRAACRDGGRPRHDRPARCRGYPSRAGRVGHCALKQPARHQRG